MGSWVCSADLETTYFSGEMFRLLGFPVGDSPPSRRSHRRPTRLPPGIGSASGGELFDTSRRDKKGLGTANSARSCRTDRAG